MKRADTKKLSTCQLKWIFVKKGMAIFICTFIGIPVFAQNPIPAIGYWRLHLNYKNTIQVIKGDKIYCVQVGFATRSFVGCFELK